MLEKEYHLSVAQFGGPIAALKNQLISIRKLIPNDPFKDHICFFSNKGKIMSRAVFDD